MILAIRISDLETQEELSGLCEPFLDNVMTYRHACIHNGISYYTTQYTLINMDANSYIFSSPISDGIAIRAFDRGSLRKHKRNLIPIIPKEDNSMVDNALISVNN